MKHIVLSVALFLLVMGVTGGCKRIRIQADGVSIEDTGCWIQIKSDSIPSPRSSLRILNFWLTNRPAQCDEPMRIHLNFYDPESEKIYLSVQSLSTDRLHLSTDKLQLLFEGRNLPREWWGAGEDWGKRYCDEPMVTCLTRVKANGEVSGNPIVKSLTIGQTTPQM